MSIKNSARRRLMLGATILGVALATAGTAPTTLHAQAARAGAPAAQGSDLLSPWVAAG